MHTYATDNSHDPSPNILVEIILHHCRLRSPEARGFVTELDIIRLTVPIVGPRNQEVRLDIRSSRRSRLEGGDIYRRAPNKAERRCVFVNGLECFTSTVHWAYSTYNRKLKGNKETREPSDGTVSHRCTVVGRVHASKTCRGVSRRAEASMCTSMSSCCRKETSRVPATEAVTRIFQKLAVLGNARIPQGDSAKISIGRLK